MRGHLSGAESSFVIGSQSEQNEGSSSRRLDNEAIPNGKDTATRLASGCAERTNIKFMQQRNKTTNTN